MMVRKLEEGYDRCVPPPSPTRATGHAMLTGTLITAVGFCPSACTSRRWANTPSRSSPSPAALLMLGGVGHFRALPRCAGYLCGPWPTGAADEPHGLFDTPFCMRFRAGELVRDAPLEPSR